MMSVHEDLISALLPSPEDCRARAASIRAANPRLESTALVMKAIKTAKSWAAGVGAASGVVANPLAMLPAASAEIGYVLRAEAALTGVIAALLDPPSLSARVCSGRSSSSPPGGWGSSSRRRRSSPKQSLSLVRSSAAPGTGSKWSASAGGRWPTTKSKRRKAKGSALRLSDFRAAGAQPRRRTQGDS